MRPTAGPTSKGQKEVADDNRLVAAAARYMRSVRDSETGWTTARTEADFIAGWRAAIEEAQRGEGLRCVNCGTLMSAVVDAAKRAAAVPAEVVAPRFHLETEPWNPPPPYSRDAIPLVESAAPPLPVVGEHEPEIEYQPTCTQCFNAVAYDEEARKWTHV